MSDPEFEITDELAGFIEALHDSEINGEIGWFFDNVWGVRIGDRLNGYKAEATFSSLPQGMRWLCDKALELYPDSAFAQDYRRLHPNYVARPVAHVSHPWPGITAEHSAGRLPPRTAPRRWRRR
jgi:hypothetical protein